jgi:soluble lytic murein transglycosylase
LLSLILLAGLAGGAVRPAESLETLARAHRQKHTPATRTALLRYASAHAQDASGALALAVAGVVHLEQRDPAQAIRELRAAQARLPLVADHLALPLAEALSGSKEHDAALRALEPVWKMEPASPLRGRAAMLAARAYLQKDLAAQAVETLDRYSGDLPQPQGLLLVARALEAKGDGAAAAGAYQRVYFGYPAASEAAEAGSALDRLRMALGAAYPPETAQAMLERVEKLAEALDYRRARSELQAMAPKLAGADRDAARVRLGAVDYQRRETAAAYGYLRSLDVPTPDADAERLYYLVACARRLNNEQAIGEYQAELARRHPGSRWRMEALIAEANHHLLDNNAAGYVPLYRACAESFPNDAQAPYCHWKVVWSEYLQRRGAAAALLREHLTRFPGSEKAGAALYFLGRLAEEANERPAARAWYAEAAARFPNSYYGLLAREKLGGGGPEGAPGAPAAINRASLAPEVREFLSRVPFPAREARPGFEPTEATRRRIERARLLGSAALDDWAVTELRYGARNGAQPHVAALELARIAARNGAHDQAIRHIKALVPGYLFLPIDAAPLEFWKLAFPLGFRAELEKYCRARSLDPFLFAALVRQESEFSPKAVSRSKAYGLAQVLPSTGRQLARTLGMRRFTASMLFLPDVNLNLGTYMFRSLVDQYGGRLEPALAAYNAGKSRADAWLHWTEFREPSEFIETIPFTETRNYVQIVLRNAAMYRRLYGAGR